VATAARARRARPFLQAGGGLTAETFAAELTPATELVVDKAHYRQHPDCKTLNRTPTTPAGCHLAQLSSLP
jgi:hypothetical protein